MEGVAIISAPQQILTPTNFISLLLNCNLLYNLQGHTRSSQHGTMLFNNPKGQRRRNLKKGGGYVSFSTQIENLGEICNILIFSDGYAVDLYLFSNGGNVR
jgi:hypothetical protein